MTKLERICDGVIEAACLAAVALTPLFVNPLTLNAHRRDKIALFQSLALLVLWAWLVALVERWRESADLRRSCIARVRRAPLMAPLAGLALVYLLATRFSVDPAASFWGGYTTAQGTHALLCGLVIAAALAVRLQHPAQRERLLTTVIVGSLPVALYGLLQHFGRDPFGSDPSQPASALRITSTLGNPIYLGAYLTMILPLSGWRLFSVVRERRQSRTRDALRWLEAALYLLVVLLEVAALYFTHSRGPFVALLASLLLALAFLAARRNRRRRLIFALAAGGALVLAFLVVLPVSAPTGTPGTISALQRLSSVVTSEESSGRTELWQAAADLFRTREPLPVPSGGQDKWPSLRLWLGYGPETLSAVLPHYAIPADVQPTLGTRFHNFIWDSWAATGIAGVALYLLTFLLIFFHVYRRLGWLSTRRDALQFWLLCGIGALGGSAGLALWQGAGFLGLGLQGGVIAAIIAYPLTRRTGSSPASTPLAWDQPTAILAMALVVALAGHFVEMGFAFETAATCVLFWVYLGILLGLLREMRSPATEATTVKVGGEAVRSTPASSRKAGSPSVPMPRLPAGEEFGRPALIAAFVVALLVISTLYTFISLYSTVPLAPGDVLRRTLLHSGGSHERIYSTLLFFATVWIAATFLLTMAEPPRGQRSRRFLAALAASGAVALAYALFKAQQISTLGAVPDPASSGEVLTAAAHSYEAIYLGCTLVFLILILLAGLLLATRADPSDRRTTRTGMVAAIVAIALYPATALSLDLNAIRADICLRWAVFVNSRGVQPATIPVFQRAVAWAPRSPPCRGLMAQALGELATAEKSPDAACPWMQQAEQTLHELQLRTPFSQADYLLGMLYLNWALRFPASDERQEWAQQAQRAFTRARIFEARTEIVWNAAAVVDLLFFDPHDGEKKNQQAFAFAPRALWSGFGALYASRSLGSADPRLKEIYATRALFYLDRVLHDPSTDDSRRFDSLMWLAQLQRAARMWSPALESYEAATQLPPGPRTWQAESSAAEACLALGRKDEALAHLAAAITSAPSSRVPDLQRIMQQIQSSP